MRKALRMQLGNTDVKKMEEHVREFKPELVCMMNEDAAHELKTRVADTDVKVTAGMQGLIELSLIHISVPTPICMKT